MTHAYIHCIRLADMAIKDGTLHTNPKELEVGVIKRLYESAFRGIKNYN